MQNVFLWNGRLTLAYEAPTQAVAEIVPLQLIPAGLIEAKPTHAYTQDLAPIPACTGIIYDAHTRALVTDCYDTAEATAWACASVFGEEHGEWVICKIFDRVEQCTYYHVTVDPRTAGGAAW